MFLDLCCVRPGLAGLTAASQNTGMCVVRSGLLPHTLVYRGVESTCTNFSWVPLTCIMYLEQDNIPLHHLESLVQASCFKLQWPKDGFPVWGARALGLGLASMKQSTTSMIFPFRRGDSSRRA